MELHELEVGERRPGAVRGRNPLADGAGGIRRALPERGRAARREERRACRDRAAVGDDADAALVVAPDGQHPLAFGDGDPRMREDALGELPRDAVAGGRSSRVHDAAAAVTALEAETLVELHPELDQVANACRRLVGEHRHGARTTEATPGVERVLGVERRIVVLPHRGGDTALGEQARGREERPLGQHEDVALGRRTQRREQSRDAATDDGESEVGVAECVVLVRSW